jgi:transcriptional regulator with XRE-family HTH domain
MPKSAVARKNPLNAGELEICRRLRQFRQQLKLSRVAFAQEAGIDSSVLVRYEHSRMPLKYVHAWRLSAVFFVRAKWLATGTGRQIARVGMPTPGALGVSENSLFSEVFDKHLAKEESSPNNRFVPDSTMDQIALRVRAEWWLQTSLQDWLCALRDEEIESFVNRLAIVGKRMFEKGSKDTPEIVAARKRKLSEDLVSQVRLRLLGKV